jgi:UDP-2-acetamido-3-amino-2,3-dideoxy-glucuronate N-acetyltransferase
MSLEHKGIFIHESSYVDENVKIGNGTKIWHFSHILNNCQIGENCTFGQNVVVGPSVVIGNKVKIQNNVSIYEGVTLEEGVFCGPSCVFTNVNNPRSEIVRKSEFRKTIVRRGGSIGANATIICGNNLGQFCFIAAGAVVTKDVSAFALMAGVPAKQIGWISKFGEKIDLPLTGSGIFKCPHGGEEYQLLGNELKIKVSD